MSCMLKVTLLHSPTQNLFIKKINRCIDLTTMPSLIDCHSLQILTIIHNENLTTLRDASLETCTSLIELNISLNNNLIISNNPLPPTLYPNLKELNVSF
jgi:hypothetical protein